MEKLFEKYRGLFFEDKCKSNRLTEYEKAFGFNDKSRNGSKPFNNVLGRFMEDVWCLSGCKKCSEGGLDAVSETCCYQFKSRHDTMKQSLAFKEIEPMLQIAIETNKEFRLIILIDKNNENRDIPLHEGFGLKKILNVEGYDETKHRWVSGDEAYKHFFLEEGKKIKTCILDYLSTIK